MLDPYEKTIRRTLKQLARQRIRVVLQPVNYWIIDNAGESGEDTDAALLTCYMRGWGRMTRGCFAEPVLANRNCPASAIGVPFLPVKKSAADTVSEGIE